MIVALTACKKTDPAPTPGVASGSGSGSATVVVVAADAGPTATEKVATALVETKAAKEAARWTDELKKRVVELRDRPYKDASEALTAILASDHRIPGHKDRDAARQTLTFFGITPTMTVVEVGAGDGWYSELLVPLLANKGAFVVVGAAPKGPVDKISIVYGTSIDLMLAKSPELYGKTTRVTLAPSARAAASWTRRNSVSISPCWQLRA